MRLCQALKLPSNWDCPTVAAYWPYNSPRTSENNRLLPEPSIVEWNSTAVSILAPMCCNGNASHFNNQSNASASWLHRNEISHRRFSHAASSRTGSRGSPSNVLMYVPGSLVMVGSNTM
ncbi:hypothetical protein D3C81_1923970 [compost metagenome]